METAIALISLIALEVVLGIDNIIFISIVADRFPIEARTKLRYWGLGLAMIMRLCLLTIISWILKLNTNLFTLFNREITGKDLILIFGGLFLLFKSTKEIHHKTEEISEAPEKHPKKAFSFKNSLIDILILDLVFSIDSIITAVGMVNELWVMYVAVIVTVLIMLFASGTISSFINQHPSFKILALCFLMMIGVSLIAEGLHFKIPKGYIYFSMAFTFFVDLVQLRQNKKI